MFFIFIPKIPLSILYQNQIVKNLILFLAVYTIILVLIKWLFDNYEKNVQTKKVLKYTLEKSGKFHKKRKIYLPETVTRYINKKIPSEYSEFTKYVFSNAKRKKQFLLAFAFISLCLIAIALTLNMYIATICLALMGLIFIGLFLIIFRTHQKNISQQIPLFLNSISNGLKAGYSFLQSIEIITDELPTPLAFYIKILQNRITLGENTEKALLYLRNQIKNSDLDFVIDSTIIQLKSGGNICKFYEKLSSNIQEKSKLDKDLKTAISQGKLSGIIIATLWPISLTLFSILSPNYVDVLFKTDIGNFLILLSLFLEITGFYIIYKITRLPL